MDKMGIVFIGCVLALGSWLVDAPFASYWKPYDGGGDFFTEAVANCYNADNEMSLRVFNNHRYIDIVLETNSPTTLRKIYNLGLAVWIDPSARYKNVLGVNFPLPTEYSYSEKGFKSYLTGFSTIGYQEELTNRFQDCEVVDNRSRESFVFSTLNGDETCRVSLKTTAHVLFSYHLRLSMDKLFEPPYGEGLKVGIGITTVDEAPEKYYSAMSSKEVIREKMDELKAGHGKDPNAPVEWWVNFELAEKP